MAALLRTGHEGELLRYRNGSGWKDVRAEDINDYLRDLLDCEVSAKDFRTWHATVMAAEGLARMCSVGVHRRCLIVQRTGDGSLHAGMDGAGHRDLGTSRCVSTQHGLERGIWPAAGADGTTTHLAAAALARGVQRRLMGHQCLQRQPGDHPVLGGVDRQTGQLLHPGYALAQRVPVDAEL